MALGFLQATKSGPLPKVPVTQSEAMPIPATAEDEATVPYSFPVKAVIPGPVDPLEGPTSPDDISGLVDTNNKILEVLQKMLVAIRVIHPNTPLPVLGNPNIAANSNEFYHFEIDGRPVPAFALFIQNNSGQTIYLGLDDPGSITGIQIPTGTGLSLSLAAVRKIGIYATVNTVVNGLVNTSVMAQIGVVVNAWGNSEFRNVWGQSA